MKIKEIQNLHSGDEVFWKDPDKGKGSRHYIIQSIEIIGKDVAVITDIDGTVLECLIEELS